jgi:hypothetical protein
MKQESMLFVFYMDTYFYLCYCGFCSYFIHECVQSWTKVQQLWLCENLSLASHVLHTRLLGRWQGGLGQIKSYEEGVKGKHRKLSHLLLMCRTSHHYLWLCVCMCVMLLVQAASGEGVYLMKRRIYTGTAITYLTCKHGSDRWILCHGNFVFMPREFQKASQLLIRVKTV